jgi:hypothetical protein
MMKTTYFLLAMTVFVVLFASACGSPPAPATQAAPPPAEVVPTQAPPEVVEPSQPPAATAQTFAPACQAAPSCAAPDVTDIAGEKNYCVEKIPYQNIAVEPGTTFESLDPTGEFKCQDSGTVVDGKNIITCAGQQLVAYELKLTSSACAANALATGTGQCQEGLGYDAAQNCCAPLDAAATGSVTITVHMGACPLPQ